METVERPAPLLELVLSTGPRIELDRPVLLGRAPEAARFAGTEVPRLVSVSNPERDISSTHAEIRPAGGHVVVTDLSSTNGTVVHRPDQPPVRLQPGTGVPVGAGAVIELGTGVTVTVERPEGAQ
ncbi:FHA domain-containing protein [Georgenia satyanarayanai]|nr:FHA domain-containing protein [Georgenia satyanarayanai]